jgi:drug/metabolite transporter (DMT)-like permease
MCVVLQGIACSGFTVFAQLWCTEKKGPVFVTMFNPLSTIMVAILAYFIFGENLYVGRYVSHDQYASFPFLYHIHTR